jgi:hypothetical protein
MTSLFKIFYFSAVSVYFLKEKDSFEGYKGQIRKERHDLLLEEQFITDKQET